MDAITSPLLARVAGRINEHVRHKKACSGDRRMRAALRTADELLGAHDVMVVYGQVKRVLL